MEDGINPALRILVVDDEQLVRWFLERALTKSGYQVSTASNIAEAFKKLGTEKIDIVFVDLRMPEGNGTELIRKMDSATLKPRVVVCSAFITPEMEEEFRAQGIYTLKKPFKLDDLNSVVQQCIVA
jgi:DNA-binding NtrC family response regulator